MHFTVHFRGKHSHGGDFSYGLVFVPCPVWVKGNQQLLSLNPQSPRLQPGCVQKLLDLERAAGTFSSLS